jgi:hypothetical protein
LRTKEWGEERRGRGREKKAESREQEEETQTDRQTDRQTERVIQSGGKTSGDKAKVILAGLESTGYTACPRSHTSLLSSLDSRHYIKGSELSALQLSSACLV